MIVSLFLSYLFGKLARIKRPVWLAQIILKAFKNFFKIDLTESKLKKFDSLYELFTREVEARKIETDYVHPIDGKLVSFGKIKNGMKFLIKGNNYSVEELLGEATNVEDHYFYNYYLSPKDYHRVHSALSGVYRYCKEIKGALYPVAPWFVKLMPSVFSKNYRTVSKIENSEGSFYMVMVGALNVGSIEMARSFFTYSDKEIKVGDHLGTFALGSSVVLISPVEFSARENSKVKFSERLLKL